MTSPADLGVVGAGGGSRAAWHPRHSLLGIGLAAAVGFAACATPPKPRELEALEAIRRSPAVTEAAKRSPDLVATSDRLGAKAREEWEANELEEARRDALMAQIKLKTALALLEQEQAKARIQALSTEQAEADEELANVSKDLAAVTEQLNLLRRLGDARKTADADKQKLSQQMSSDQQKAQAEQQRLAQQLVTEQKMAAAQLALKTADTVEASKYAPPEYAAANDMFAKAQAEVKQGNFQGAQASADVAKKNADRATELSKPLYAQNEQTAQNRARDDALGKDASAIPGVSVRLERKGDLQRLVISVPDIFAKKQTSFAAGKDAILDPIAALINKYPTYPIQIIGHTDNKGKAGELLALSNARAQSVYSALATRGVDGKRMLVSGVGGEQPIVDNRTAANRARNNRIEIIFLYHH
jgi:outer membrane protein OmpA-like peptidoglycan-associated protein